MDLPVPTNSDTAMLFASF